MICRGEADIEQVLKDVMGLTKLNYNSCRHSDGWPVTLKFADAVGEVLISGPAISNAPLAFKHYILAAISGQLNDASHSLALDDLLLATG